MLNLTRHKGIRVLFEDLQAGLRAKVNSFSLIDGTWEIPRVLQRAAAGRPGNIS
jgi:hypothetical protein